MVPASSSSGFDFVVAANRLPVDRHVHPDGSVEWRTSPGGLVTAMESVMQDREAAWVGWAGFAGEAPEPFDDGALRLCPVPLSTEEVADYYEGFSNDTLWPIYHDVIVPPTFHRSWWHAYRRVNERFAEAVAEVAAEGATVWVHDYQLQLVPALLRDRRPDLRIGWFNHIPFPPVELFSQLPWRAAILRGLLGADFLGFQRADDARNFMRACRSVLRATAKGDVVTWAGADDAQLGAAPRRVRAAAVPISIDAQGLRELAGSPEVQDRVTEIRASLGNPKVVLLGVDRLDYTKGIRHRLRAIGELLEDGEIAPPDVVFVQIATPSRERVEAYRLLREEIEGTVGRINGDFSHLGDTAVHYLHQSFGREEIAAFFQVADVMLVTPLRDGMNLVAKEYVTARHDGGGALVLSEFTGAAMELRQAYMCNPHDIAGLKETILRAIRDNPAAKRRRMSALRRRVHNHDVQTWAGEFLSALAAAPDRPAKSSSRLQES
ncbi:alpha,alpha-trehalose-phosphate synthase (UDP-forming) [Ornithinimicrobium pratense]|uniref:Trehalose-6-phosphate synthase n=1 Tax=Ornithinimicrobium pratense TaxID=2593973 RepID=A0A5J6V8N6_9MICO|nr:trehalose-6-phosphate synthase [Ornithinimicrobium pratense]QFG69516.1 trehalose-6-phosphate synthase [Ornithinimicrobium pratense]